MASAKSFSVVNELTHAFSRTGRAEVDNFKPGDLDSHHAFLERTHLSIAEFERFSAVHSRPPVLPPVVTLMDKIKAGGDLKVADPGFLKHLYAQLYSQKLVDYVKFDDNHTISLLYWKGWIPHQATMKMYTSSDSYILRIDGYWASEMRTYVEQSLHGQQPDLNKITRDRILRSDQPQPTTWAEIQSYGLDVEDIDTTLFDFPQTAALFAQHASETLDRLEECLNSVQQNSSFLHTLDILLRQPLFALQAAVHPGMLEILNKLAQQTQCSRFIVAQSRRILARLKGVVPVRSRL